MKGSWLFVLRKSRLISAPFYNHRSCLACAWGCPTGFCAYLCCNPDARLVCLVVLKGSWLVVLKGWWLVVLKGSWLDVLKGSWLFCASQSGAWLKLAALPGNIFTGAHSQTFPRGDLCDHVETFSGMRPRVNVYPVETSGPELGNATP